MRDLYQIFVHVVHGRRSVLPRWGGEIPRERGNFGLYSIAFGTDTKTAELIEMPFGLMTRLGPRYLVLDGGSDPPKERGNFGGKRSCPL